MSIRTLTLSVLLLVALYAPAVAEQPICRPVDGYCFEAATGLMYLGGKPAPFTFEDAKLATVNLKTGQVAIADQNPFQFATQATAEKMAGWLKDVLNGATVSIKAVAPTTGVYFYNVPMRLLVVNGNAYNAGLMAGILMREGEDMARLVVMANVEAQ